MDVVLLNEIYAPVEMIICFFYKTNMVSLSVSEKHSVMSQVRMRLLTS